MKPYIGVTGFVTREEVASALAAFPRNGPRVLMVGVLASWKSLRGIPLKPKWQQQTPAPECISKIFLRDARTVNLVHYSVDEEHQGALLRDLLEIHTIVGPNLDGFQLNVSWPEIRLLDEYRMAVGYDYRIVLQIGQPAVEKAEGSPDGVVALLEHYVSVVDDVLFDPSGGRGQPFDAGRAHQFLLAIAEQGWGVGLGVAGGLGPGSVDRLVGLVEEFPNLSVDAQGRLRDPENNLDREAVKQYLAEALVLFS